MAGGGATPGRRRGLVWPFFLAGLLLAGVGANVAFMVIATHDPSFAVEPDYYRKALAWDGEQAQEARNRALGWSVRVGAGSAAAGHPGQLRLVATVVDAGGAPLDGAQVSLEARHGAHAADAIAGRLDPAGRGTYAADLPLRRPGLWELRVRIVRGPDVFTTRLWQDLPGTS